MSPRDLALQVGGYVIIEHEGKTRLGQLLDLELELVDGPEIGIGADQADAQLATTVMLRIVRGSGVIRDGDATPFHDGLLRTAVPAEVHAWLEHVRPTRAELEIGELRLAPGAPFRLDGGGLRTRTAAKLSGGTWPSRASEPSVPRRTRPCASIRSWRPSRRRAASVSGGKSARGKRAEHDPLRVTNRLCDPTLDIIRSPGVSE